MRGVRRAAEHSPVQPVSDALVLEDSAIVGRDDVQSHERWPSRVVRSWRCQVRVKKIPCACGALRSGVHEISGSTTE